MEASGIEADQRRQPGAIEQQSGAIGAYEDPANVTERASKCAIVRGVVTESSEACELSIVVETALAKTLVLAAEAKRWDVVTLIAGELQRRGSAQPTSAPSERLKRSSKV